MAGHRGRAGRPPCCSGWSCPGSGSRSGLEVAVPCLYVAAVAALRHAAGGSPSGYSALYWCPSCGSPCTGSRARWLVTGGGHRGHGRAHRAGRRARLPDQRVATPDHPGRRRGDRRPDRPAARPRGPRGRRAGRGRQLGHRRPAGHHRGAHQRRPRMPSCRSIGRAPSCPPTARRPASSAADLVGRNVFATLVPPDELERLQAGFQRLIEADVPGVARHASRPSCSGRRVAGAGRDRRRPDRRTRRACSSTRSCAT